MEARPSSPPRAASCEEAQARDDCLSSLTYCVVEGDGPAAGQRAVVVGANGATVRKGIE